MFWNMVTSVQNKSLEIYAQIMLYSCVILIYHWFSPSCCLIWCPLLQSWMSSLGSYLITNFHAYLILPDLLYSPSCRNIYFERWGEEEDQRRKGSPLPLFVQVFRIFCCLCFPCPIIFEFLKGCQSIYLVIGQQQWIKSPILNDLSLYLIFVLKFLLFMSLSERHLKGLARREEQEGKSAL